MRLHPVIIAALAGVSLLSASSAFSGDEGAKEPAASSTGQSSSPSWPWAQDKGVSYTGSVTERYRSRFTEGDSDGDLESIADLSVNNLFGGRMSVHLNAGLFIDVVGSYHSHRENCGSCHAPNRLFFQDVYDAYDTPAQGRIYTLYAELHDVVEGLDVRLGRQMLSKGESVRLDGATASYKPSDLVELTVGAGLPVYQDDPHIISNALGAAYLEIFPGTVIDGLPARSSKITLEFLHVEDGKENARDDYAAIHLWQRFFGGASTLYLRTGALNGRIRETRASLTARCPTTGLQLRARYLHSPSAWGEEGSADATLTHELSPFIAVMGALQPYQQLDLDLYDEFSPSFGLEIGAAFRKPVRNRLGSRYNHDFDRYHAAAYGYDLFVKGFDASAIVEFYSSRGNEDGENVLSWGFDLSWRANEKLDLSLGSHFQKYRVVYDPDSPTRLSETTDVRLVSLSARYALRDDIDLGLRYEIESDAGDFEKLFHTIEVRVRWKL